MGGTRKISNKKLYLPGYPYVLNGSLSSGFWVPSLGEQHKKVRIPELWGSKSGSLIVKSLPETPGDMLHVRNVCLNLAFQENPMQVQMTKWLCVTKEW